MCRFPNSRFVLLSVAAMFAVAAVPSAALAQEKGEKKPVAKKVKKPIYDEQADAKADIAAAVARAKKNNKRVLVMYGGNWCGWCYKLHDVFKKDSEVARTLLYEYERVMVDIGRMDKHQDIVKGYGAKINGVPFLTVLDGDGKVVVNQPTDPLEEGDHHDPDKVQAFLTKHKAEPWDAKDLFDKALARAESQGKMVFMHFGAPWCVWCRRLEAFLDQDEVAAIMNRDFVDLKIDIDRMTGGKDIKAKY
ncbi:MAG: thioredoxin family protein, partial [Planctomycetes bacterium]|nr:thioredoxin family protein [Planctomycetota bacterium]